MQESRCSHRRSVRLRGWDSNRDMRKANRGEGIVEDQCRQQHTRPDAQLQCPNWVLLHWLFASAYPLTVIGVLFGVKGMPFNMCLEGGEGDQCQGCAGPRGRTLSEVQTR